MAKSWMFLASIFLTVSPSHADEKKKKQANDAVQAYLKAIQDKNAAEAAKYASTPWLTGDEKLIKDEAELGKHLAELAITIDPKRLAGEVKNVIRYADYRKEAAEEKQQTKFIDWANQILEDDDWIVLVADKQTFNLTYFLMRQRKGKVTIASGPHRLTYLMIDNALPEELKNVLENAEELELYSIDPVDFKKHVELGKTVIKDADLRKKIVAEFKKGVEDSMGFGANCFNPRHRIKAKYKEHTVDLWICFECFRLKYSLDGKEEKQLLISEEPQKLFDKMLTDAGVKLPAKRKE